MESLIANPGFAHLSQNILKYLDKKSLLTLRLVSYTCKKFIEDPRFWLKFNSVDRVDETDGEGCSFSAHGEHTCQSKLLHTYGFICLP